MPGPTPERNFALWRSRCDAQALGRVFDAVAPELLVVAGHVAGRGEAEDLVQGTFLQAIEHAERWDASRPLKPWLVGILIRLSRRERERTRRQVDADRLRPVAEPGPQDAAQSEEFARALSEALDGMPATYRPTLTMRLAHGLTPTEIAHALGEPVATVKSRLQRGMDLLRKALPASLGAASILVAAPRALAEVKVAVLTHASEWAGATAAAGTGTAAGAAAAKGAATAVTGLGVMMLMNKVTLSVVAAAVCVGAVALVWSNGHSTPAPEVAGREGPAPVTALTDDAPVETPSAGTGLDVAGPGRVAVDKPVQDTPEFVPQWAGRVVDEAGSGLPGVAVFLALPGRASHFSEMANALWYISRNGLPDDGHDGVARTETSADGSFAFPVADDDAKRTVVAWSDDRGCQIVGLDPTDPAPIVITLPQGLRLAGVVRSGVDRSPLEGSMVHVYPEKSGMPLCNVPTDADGRFETPPLPVQRYRSFASLVGFEDEWVTVAAGDQAIEFELTALPVLTATLVDAAHNAWTSARIADAVGGLDKLRFELTKKSYQRFSELTADTFDRAQLQFEPDTGVLSGAMVEPTANRLSIWNGVEKLGEVTVEDTSAERIVIAFEATQPIELEVQVHLDPSTEAGIEATVTAGDLKWGGSGLAPFESTSTTQGRARIAVPASFAGSECAVLIECAGYAEHYAWVAIPANAARAWHEVTLRPGGSTLRGRVRGSDGRPPSVAEIFLCTLDGTTLWRPSRSRKQVLDDGAFEFDGLPAGKVRLLVSAEGCAPRAIIAETDTAEDLVIELTAGRELKLAFSHGHKTQLRVLDSAGLPIQDDRLSGTMRYGRGANIRVDVQSVTVEAYDSVTGALRSTGLVPAHGELTLEAPR